MAICVALATEVSLIAIVPVSEWSTPTRIGRAARVRDAVAYQTPVETITIRTVANTVILRILEKVVSALKTGGPVFL